MILSQQKWSNQRSSANHIRLAIIVYNISYSALSNPMNIFSTVGGFWVNEVSQLDSLVILKATIGYALFVCLFTLKNNANISA